MFWRSMCPKILVSFIFELEIYRNERCCFFQATFTASDAQREPSSDQRKTNWKPTGQMDEYFCMEATETFSKLPFDMKIHEYSVDAKNYTATVTYRCKQQDKCNLAAVQDHNACRFFNGERQWRIIPNHVDNVNHGNVPCRCREGNQSPDTA